MSHHTIGGRKLVISMQFRIGFQRLYTRFRYIFSYPRPHENAIEKELTRPYITMMELDLLR